MTVNKDVQAAVTTYKRLANKILGKRFRWLTHSPDEVRAGKLLLDRKDYTVEQIDLLCAGFRILGLRTVYDEPWEGDAYWIIAFLIESGDPLRVENLMVYISSVEG
jgi:hypothetical protein